MARSGRTWNRHMSRTSPSSWHSMTHGLMKSHAELKLARCSFFTLFSGLRTIKLTAISPHKRQPWSYTVLPMTWSTTSIHSASLSWFQFSTNLFTQCSEEPRSDLPHWSEWHLDFSLHAQQWSGLPLCNLRSMPRASAESTWILAMYLLPHWMCGSKLERYGDLVSLACVQLLIDT